MQESYIKICKRFNNPKRDFFVVNTAMCRFVPSRPSVALEMFDELGNIGVGRYIGEKLLAIGFAEAAVALGLEVASVIDNCDYIQTTRQVCDAPCIGFSESHSHAPEHRLYCTDFSKYDRVLFIEDEVTTGNTLLSIVEELEKHGVRNFGVLTVIDGMSSKNREKFENRDIHVDSLLRLDSNSFSDLVKDIHIDGNVSKTSSTALCDWQVTLSDNELPDTRFVVNPREYKKILRDMLMGVIPLDVSDKKHLIIGIEEFTYPAIYYGKMLEDLGNDVVCCTVTRSPITASQDDGYIIRNVYEMPSAYDNTRKTFIYNLTHYDNIDIPHDLESDIRYLVSALEKAGNDINSVLDIKIPIRKGKNYDEK